ncbi:hypothetical protein HDU79_008993 [Rhizoclosmatium sp. JEL0117]|nr:hypothetical protein HDU79_008993 [Rhizoclosmatium sp. JEL0117]
MQTPQNSASIYSLATEVIQDILRYLPINAKLREVGLASKSLFASSVFLSSVHTKEHIKQAIKISGQTSFWMFVHTSGIFMEHQKWGSTPPCSWLLLPHIYRLELYRMALQSVSSRSFWFWALEIDGVSWTCPDMFKIVSTLLSSTDFDPSFQKNRALQWACKQEQLEVVKLLLSDSRVDPSANNNLLLVSVCNSANVDLLQIILTDSRIDPSAVNNRALSVACRTGTVEGFQVLLDDKRFDPYKCDNLFCLAVCRLKNADDVVDLLLKDGRADPGGDENSALLMAARKGCANIISKLLRDSRVDPMSWNCGALCEAAKKGHKDVALLLLNDSRVDPATNYNVVIRSAFSERITDANYNENDACDLLQIFMNDPRIDLGAGDSQVLCNVVLTENCKALKMLISDNRVNPSCHANLPIRLAADFCNLECLSILLNDDRVDPLSNENNALFSALERDWDVTPAVKDVINAILNDRRVVNRAKNYGLVCDLHESENWRVNRLLLYYGFCAVGEMNPLHVFEDCKRLDGDESPFKQKVFKLWKLKNINVKISPRTALQCLLLNWNSLVKL